MKSTRWMVVLAMLFVGCGGDNGAGPGPGPGNDNTPDAVATAPGTPDGAPVTTTIGAGGGSLTSSDGHLTVVIPPGALGANTDITIQPLTNTAWGGTGAAYRLTPDGLTFVTPVDLEFEVAPEVLGETAANFLDVAVQDAQGFWYTLKNRTYDGGTLTGQTSHFSDYSMIEGVQIRPASANVGLSEVVTLTVRSCYQETYSGDEDLVALVYTCDEDLAPLGTFTDWSVNSVKGGNSTIGHVAATSSHAAHYTAPSAVPNPSTVAVSVNANYRSRSELLVCNITISNDWTGTATVEQSQGTGNALDVDHAVFTLAWTMTGTFGNLEFLAPSGSVTYTPWSDPDCPQVSFGPATHEVSPSDGFMQIDHSTNPATFFWSIATIWNADYCYNCGEEVVCAPFTVVASLGLAEGEVSNDGKTIAGFFLDDQTGDSYAYNFSR